MRILFLHAHERLFESETHPRHHLAPLDLAGAMGSATRDGHDVTFVETTTGELDARGLALRLDRDPAELVVIEATYDALPYLERLIRMARPRERCVVLTGAATAHAPTGALARSGARALARCEGDEVATEIATRLEARRPLDDVRGLVLFDDGAEARTAPRPLERELDRLPMPRHDLLLEHPYKFHYPLRARGRLRMGYLRASRGCPYACIFCSEVERSSFGKPYRAHGPARVADELRTLARLGATGAYFEDDLFAIDRARLLAVCDAIERAQTGVPWSAQLRAGDVDDTMAEALARAGCASVACGIESGSDRVLGLLRKGTTVDAMRRGARALRRAGIELVAYLVVGVPTERPEERDATLRLAEELDASIVQLHVFASYPGTYAARRFPELGADGATKYTPAASRVDHAELAAVQRRFYRRFYLRPDRLVRHAARRFPQLLADPRGELEVAWRLTRHALRGP